MTAEPFRSKESSPDRLIDHENYKFVRNYKILRLIIWATMFFHENEQLKGFVCGHIASIHNQKRFEKNKTIFLFSIS